MSTDNTQSVFIIPEIHADNVSISGPDTSSILCIVNAKEYGAPQENLLKKMMSAVNLSLESDVMLMNLDEGQIINPAMLQLDYRIIIVFGSDPARVSLNICYKPYHICPLDQRRALFCDALTVLESSQDKKKQLWEALKNLFDIK